MLIIKYILTQFSFLPVAKETAGSSSEPENNDELEQITIARALLNYRLKEKIAMSNPNSPIPFPRKFQIQNLRPTNVQPPPVTTSKILPLICPKTAARSRNLLTTSNESPQSRPPFAAAAIDNFKAPPQSSLPENRGTRPMKFPAVGATPYVPIRQMRLACRGIAPPVTIRTAVPVFSAPPLPPPATVHHQVLRPPPVNIRQAVPVYAAPPVRKDEPAPVQKKDQTTVSVPSQRDTLPVKIQGTDTESKTEYTPLESYTVQRLGQLKI